MQGDVEPQLKKLWYSLIALSSAKPSMKGRLAYGEPTLKKGPILCGGPRAHLRINAVFHINSDMQKIGAIIPDAVCFLTTKRQLIASLNLHSALTALSAVYSTHARSHLLLPSLELQWGSECGTVFSPLRMSKKQHRPRSDFSSST